MLSEGHLAIFDFCCEVNAYINQQFASRRAKWLHSREQFSDFALGQHTISMKQARRLKDQVQDVHEEKMTIIALDSATPLESNDDMVLVRELMDCHIQSFVPASGQKKLDGFAIMHLQQFIAQCQPEQN